MAEEIEDGKKIVYVYNYSDLVMITRTKSGEWFYAYTIQQVFDRINKNRLEKDPKSDTVQPTSSKNLWEVGKSFGIKVNELLKYCQQSYGDEPTGVL